MSSASVSAMAPASISIRVVSLPRELKTTHLVANFFELALGLGRVHSVYIKNMETTAGTKYQCASVHFSNCYDNQFASQVFGDLKANGEFVLRGQNFTFSNGKSMDHLRFTVDKSGPSYCAEESNPAEVDKDDWMSVYIPVVPIDLDIDSQDYTSDEMLRKFFEDDLKVGKVSRIDYVNKVKGQTNIRSAYVHFDYWCDSLAGHSFRKKLNTSSDAHITGYYDGFEYRNFSGGRYMVMKINHSPIPEADPELNIHQLVAVNQELSRINADQAKEIVELKSRLAWVALNSDSGKLTLEDLAC